jgi:hypothetical protein
MKTLNIIMIKILGLLFLTVFISSCSDEILDRINKDDSHPKGVDAKYIIADVITATAFLNVGGDFNTYFSTYVEHEVGVHNQLFRAETRSGEPYLATTFNNKWISLYNALKDARIAIALCSKGGRQEGNDVTKGIAEALAAYNSALITDAFGDAPWSEAALVKENGTPLYVTPKIDKQEDIYKGIMELLDSAIVDLQGNDSHSETGGYDLLYGGDASKWIKFAYGLKARYTMRLLHRTTDKAGAYDKVLDYVSKSFASAGEQAAFAVYDANNLNPLFDFQWSRSGLGASASLAAKLIERNDPRLRRVFTGYDDNDGLVQIFGTADQYYFMAPNGEPEELQDHYNTSTFVYSQTAPTLLLSYHELLFLKAEALARKGDRMAKDVLKEAVVAAIANTEINVTAALSAPDLAGYWMTTTDAVGPDEAAGYFDASVAPLYDADPLSEVMVQKYLAFFGASGESTECYNDIRRLKALGETFITLANTGKFPLRCGYGNSDTTTNPAVQEAYGNGQYVYDEPVWWAGGTR